jgi:hypothetical protein
MSGRNIPFKELDPDAIRSLLDERDAQGRLVHQDMLKPALEKEEAFFRNSPCPVCRDNATEAFVDPTRPFLSGSIIANRHLRCLKCHAEYDPYTGLILKATSSPA